MNHETLPALCEDMVLDKYRLDWLEEKASQARSPLERRVRPQGENECQPTTSSHGSLPS